MTMKKCWKQNTHTLISSTSINFNTLLSLSIMLIFLRFFPPLFVVIVVKFTLYSLSKRLLVYSYRSSLIKSQSLILIMQFCHFPNKLSIFWRLNVCMCVKTASKMQQQHLLIGRMSKLNKLTYGFGAICDHITLITRDFE